MNTSNKQHNHQPLAVIILAAGHGTRMRSSLTKVLHPIAGMPMLGHVMHTAQSLNPERMAVIIGDHSPEVGNTATKMLPTVSVFVQSPPLGTGDAVKYALPALEGFSGTVLVLYADTPLIHAQTLSTLAQEVENGSSVSVLGFTPSVEHAYGRLIVDKNRTLIKIVEHKDASEEERQINFCNSGVMAIESSFLQQTLPNLSNENAKGEYYLTDLVGMATDKGLRASTVEASETEVMGVDSRPDLAIAEKIWQERKRQQVMQDGVTLADPSTVYFSYDTQLGQDVTIGQNVVFGPGVTLADNVDIKPFSHLEGANLDSGVAAGPFARLRPGANLGQDVKVGNFVEIKKADLAEGAKVSHLTYIGDAILGKEVNIGAGTITCNYDGFNKHQTVIKDNAFIGSNSSLVAPVTIGEGAYVGSGSVITKDVDADGLAVARGRQSILKGWAQKFRSKNKK